MYERERRAGGRVRQSTKGLHNIVRSTIYTNDKLWTEFRIACLARETSISQELTMLMEERLKEWGYEPPKVQKVTARGANND